jgi:hypothetical protein
VLHAVVSPMQQQPAWKSVYSSGPTTQRHRREPRQASSSDSGVGRSQSKQQRAAQPYGPCTAAAAAGRQQCSDNNSEEQCINRESGPAESNHACNKQQLLSDTRPSTSSKLRQSAHSNSSAAPVATALHAQTALCRPLPSHSQQLQQQRPADAHSRPASTPVAASTASSTHPASTRRLSSPPAQAVSTRPAQQQALSPYLAALLVTARYVHGIDAAPMPARFKQVKLPPGCTNMPIES